MHFQRLIQTEADMMRLEEVHSSLFNEHKNLQEDYERIHIYVEVSFSKGKLMQLYLQISRVEGNFFFT